MGNIITLNRNVEPREYDVFLGLDVDKSSIAVTCVDHYGLLKSSSMPHKSENLLNFVRNRYEGKRVAFVYEAGPTGFGLYDAISAQGYDCLVVSPSSVPKAPGRRVRTNRLDSRKLALQLKGGYLEGIHVPSQTYRMLRELVNLRKMHVKASAASKCRIKQLFLRNGIEFIWKTPGGYWSCDLIRQLRQFECDPVLRFKLDSLLDVLESSRKQAVKSQALIRRYIEADSDISESMQYLLSVPGVGWVVASYAIARIGDWRELGNSSHTAGFFGLVPREDSTGDDSNRGSITKSGDPTMRSLLIQAAWQAIRKDRELAAFYEQVYKSHPKNTAARQAIVAVSRKLATRIHCVLKERRMYQPKVSA